MRRANREKRSCSNPSACPPRRGAEFAVITLNEIVKRYLRDDAPREKAYLDFFRAQPSLKAAISTAALAEYPDGKRFSHQRRIPGQVLQQAKHTLITANFARVKTFSELFDLVASKLESIRGIGPLTIYDTAHRIGAYLGFSPEFVYIHAGAREGAKALDLPHRVRKLPITAFPQVLQKLRPEQIEDCLCIYKPHFEQRKANKARRSRISGDR